MAATLDKDTLVKHSFWILSGCYVVLVLACLSVLATSVSDSVRKEEEELQKAEKTVTSINDPKNDKVLEAYKQQDKLVEGKKNTVWSEAWETQKDMMTWPRDLQARFQKYKYFGEPIALADRYEFDEKYKDQFMEVLDVVQPVKPKGDGVVQCKGSWWDVLALDKTFQKPASKDDIWLAQEELWVKRELLRIIREANESVARFKEVPSESAAEKETKEIKAGPVAEKNGKPAKVETAALEKDQKAVKPIPAAAKPDANHKVFRNAYWEFDLTLAGPEQGKFVLRGKLTNIGKRKQPLDTKFKVFLQDPRTVQDPSFELVSVASLPLAVGESKEITNHPVPQQKAIEGLFGVEQVLNWKTAAVKRLDDLRLMYTSSRTMRELKPPRFLVAAPTEGGDSAAPADAGAPAAGIPGPGGGERGGPSPYGVDSQGTPQTLSGLEINRYTDVSDQVRHMPVAMVVIVDEEHLPELLAAFVNSKLRIQITQYHWQHCRDHMNPDLNEENQQFTPSAPSGQRAATPDGPMRNMMPGGRKLLYGPGSASGFTPGGRERGLPGPGGRERGLPGPGGPGGARPFGPPGPSTGGGIIGRGPTGTGSASEDEEQEDLNLLEVAVYGLASLYERYPPAAKQASEPSSTPDAKQPAAGSTDTTGGK